MFVLYEILRELRNLLVRSFEARPVVILGCGAAAFALVCMILLSWTLGPPRDPFSYCRIHGCLTYEDGEVLPAKEVTLTFVPVDVAADSRRHPRTGQATLIPETGRFEFASTRRRGDGVVAGWHKVLVTGPNRLPLAVDVVSPDYSSFDTTPLKVDSRSGRLDLKVGRPPPLPPKGKAVAGR